MTKQEWNYETFMTWKEVRKYLMENLFAYRSDEDLVAYQALELHGFQVWFKTGICINRSDKEFKRYFINKLFASVKKCETWGDSMLDKIRIIMLIHKLKDKLDIMAVWDKEDIRVDYYYDKKIFYSEKHWNFNLLVDFSDYFFQRLLRNESHDFYLIQKIEKVLGSKVCLEGDKNGN